MAETLVTKLAREIWSDEQRIKELESQITMLEKAIYENKRELIETMAEEGVQTTGFIPGVGEMRLKPTSYPSVSKADMPRFVAYVRASGCGDIVQQIVAAEDVKDFVRDEIDNITQEFLNNEDYFIVEARKVGIKPDPINYSRVAAKMLAVHGVKTFLDMGISHLKKGKEQ